MTPRPASAPPGRPVPNRGTKLLIGIKADDYLRKRMKVAVAEDGHASYADLLNALLDDRERRRNRARKAMPSPLHRPLTGDEL